MFLAMAQPGLPRAVLVVTHKVAQKDREAFVKWIADFRAAVEKLIGKGSLSQADLCAYKSWRVLGPDAAGLNEDFIFVFEPVILIASYSIRYCLTQALVDAETSVRMTEFDRLASKPKTFCTAPLTKADAVDLGEVCEFSRSCKSRSGSPGGGSARRMGGPHFCGPGQDQKQP